MGYVFRASLERVTCPAGLQQLEAITPPEIALSIMAEIVQLRRQQEKKGRREARATVPPATTETAADAEAMDPVCGMTVRVIQARYTSEYDDKTFYFCCIGCKERFERDAERYAAGVNA